MLTILKVVVAQIDVLDTMTPRQFTGFRRRLDASSGFQSVQFRELETVFGRRDRAVLDAYPDPSAARARPIAALTRPSVYDSFLRYFGGRGHVGLRTKMSRSPTTIATIDVNIEGYELRKIKYNP